VKLGPTVAAVDATPGLSASSRHATDKTCGKRQDVAAANSCVAQSAQGRHGWISKWVKYACRLQAAVVYS